MTSRYQAIEQVFWPKGFSRNIWMILDCARDQKQIFRFILGCHLDYRCLYSGTLHPALEMAAPYLLQLDVDSQETRRLIELSWGNSWGVFLKSETSLNSLRRHLREFLIVKDSKGRRMTFRYYDPRVLRTYLPTCTAEELRTVFGPIECFWTEDPKEPDQLMDFRLEQGRLVRKKLALGRPLTSTLPESASQSRT
jgi:hypothetical protein